jgi:hypothetical protein
MKRKMAIFPIEVLSFIIYPYCVPESRIKIFHCFKLSLKQFNPFDGVINESYFTFIRLRKTIVKTSKTSMLDSMTPLIGCLNTVEKRRKRVSSTRDGERSSSSKLDQYIVLELLCNQEFNEYIKEHGLIPCLF